MRIGISVSAWIRGTVGLVSLAASMAAASPAHAQVAADNGKFYTKQHVFHLPINIEDKTRNSIREVALCVKTPGGEWQKCQSALPTQRSFEYRAPSDGEFWFTLVTVDAKGQANPSDMMHLAPDDVIRVVVDTEPPNFELQTIKLPSGDLQVRCSVIDVNPDPRAVKITWQGRDQVAHALEPVAGQLGVYRIPTTDVFMAPVRVSVTDMAGNTTAKDVNLQDVPTQTNHAVEPAKVPQETMKAAVQQTSFTETAPAVPVQQPASPVYSPDHKAMSSPAAGSPAAASPAGTAMRMLLNTTHASLDYHIDQVGPSGVGKVEVWMTADQGHSWQRLCEDKNRRSPTEFNLPGDGLFGIRVVVTNGNGFGGRPPVAGDQPQCVIEVDTVAPTVALRDAEPITNGSSIDLRWTASDKNLGTEPVNLFFATHKEGPWQPVAMHLKNDGVYRWNFPRDAGGQFFIRAEVTDLAGNVTKTELPSAIVLDMTEPRASVVGVTGIRGAATSGHGN